MVNATLDACIYACTQQGFNEQMSGFNEYTRKNAISMRVFRSFFVACSNRHSFQSRFEIQYYSIGVLLFLQSICNSSESRIERIRKRKGKQKMMLIYIRNMQNPLNKQINSFEHQIYMYEMEVRTVYNNSTAQWVTHSVFNAFKWLTIDRRFLFVWSSRSPSCSTLPAVSCIFRCSYVHYLKLSGATMSPNGFLPNRYTI